MTLSNLNIGQSAKIKSFIKGQKPYRHKLLAMGLTPNTILTLIRKAPLGDPVQIQVRDFCLTLRQSEAELLQLELITDAND